MWTRLILLCLTCTGCGPSADEIARAIADEQERRSRPSVEQTEREIEATRREIDALNAASLAQLKHDLQVTVSRFLHSPRAGRHALQNLRDRADPDGFGSAERNREARTIRAMIDELLDRTQGAETSISGGHELVTEIFGEDFYSTTWRAAD